MTLDFIWIDLWLKDNNFGVGFFTIKPESEDLRSLLAVYWNDGQLLLDIFWFHILPFRWRS